MRPIILPAVALCGLLLTQCKTNNSAAAEQLPPATQTGANTFGCRVNGQVWLPKGNSGGPNSVALYDPGINTPGGAQLNIETYRNGPAKEYINLACGPITPQKRVFPIEPTLQSGGASSYNGFYGDFTSPSNLSYLKGQLTLTRMDEPGRVVSGTFWFTALRQGSSDTLKVTDGRFDYKF